MTLGGIIDALERFAPLAWQEEYDNSGLQVGLFDEAGMPLGREALITGVLVCLDITEAVIDEAAARGCNLVVSHHPLIFRPLKAVTGAVYQQRCVAKALRLGIALYAAHTNLDNAPGGVSWEMAVRLGLQEVRPLVPLAAAPASATPSTSTTLVSTTSSASAAPASAAPSTSTTLVSTTSSASAAPASATPSTSTTLVSTTSSASAAPAACLSARPGSGVIGVLPQPVPAEDFVRTLAAVFNAPHLRFCLPSKPASLSGDGAASPIAAPSNVAPASLSDDGAASPIAAPSNVAPASLSDDGTASPIAVPSNVAPASLSGDGAASPIAAPSNVAPASLSDDGTGNAATLIRTVALCGGSGGEYIPDALAAGADCYVTGEIRYHDYFEAEGRMLVALGHYESEQYTIDLLARKLQEIISQESAPCGASSHSSCASPAQPSCDPSSQESCASGQKIPILKTTLNTNPLKGL